MKLSDMDFSMENDFQERLLKKIKSEYFAELSDDDMGFVNAAGILNPDGMAILLHPDQLKRD